MGVLDHLHVVRYLDVALLERPEVKEAGEAVAVRRAYRGPFGAVEDALELHEEALLVLQPWFALVRHRRHRRHYARAPVLSTLSMPEISIFCTSTPISREFEAASTVHEPECETLKFQPRTRSRCLSLSPSSTWCASISTAQHNTTQHALRQRRCNVDAPSRACSSRFVPAESRHSRPAASRGTVAVSAIALGAAANHTTRQA